MFSIRKHCFLNFRHENSTIGLSLSSRKPKKKKFQRIGQNADQILVECAQPKSLDCGKEENYNIFGQETELDNVSIFKKAAGVPAVQKRRIAMNSTEKVVALMKILGHEPYVYGVTELGEMIGCGKSGTFKLLNVLVKEGLAAQTADHKYTLGIGTYLLGKRYEENVGVVRAVRPYMNRLRDLTGETITFGMLVNGRPMGICRADGTNMVRVLSHMGNDRPVYAGGIGMVLGAYMDPDTIREMLMEDPPHPFTSRTITDPYKVLEQLAKIREQGYAICDGDIDLDTITFGAPLLDHEKQAWAALVLSAPRSRVDDVVRDRYLFQVRETAKQISKELGFAG